jgi:hypothetical protein
MAGVIHQEQVLGTTAVISQRDTDFLGSVPIDQLNTPLGHDEINRLSELISTRVG